MSRNVRCGLIQAKNAVESDRSLPAIKKAMIEVEAALEAAGLQGRMLLQLHDELLFEVPQEELAETARRVRRVMEDVVELKAPLVVDLRQGPSWGEMHVLAKFK